MELYNFNSLFPLPCNYVDKYVVFRTALTSSLPKFDGDEGVLPTVTRLSTALCLGLCDPYLPMLKKVLEQYCDVKCFGKIDLSELSAFSTWLTVDTVAVLTWLKTEHLDCMIEGLLFIMNERSSETSLLSVGIVSLVYLIERHNLKSSILTDTNITQLFRLLLTRVVVSSSGNIENENGLHINDESSLCRMGIRRLLQIDVVKSSPAVVKEAVKFVEKWWRRISDFFLSTSTESVKHKFNDPYVIRRILEIIGDIFDGFAGDRSMLHRILLSNGLSTPAMPLLTLLMEKADIRTSCAGCKIFISLIEDILSSEILGKSPDIQDLKQFRIDISSTFNSLVQSLRRFDMTTTMSIIINDSISEQNMQLLYNRFFLERYVIEIVSSMWTCARYLCFSQPTNDLNMLSTADLVEVCVPYTTDNLALLSQIVSFMCESVNDTTLTSSEASLSGLTALETIRACILLGTRMILLLWVMSGKYGSLLQIFFHQKAHDFARSLVDEVFGHLTIQNLDFLCAVIEDSGLKKEAPSMSELRDLKYKEIILICDLLLRFIMSARPSRGDKNTTSSGIGQNTDLVTDKSSTEDNVTMLCDSITAGSISGLRSSGEWNLQEKLNDVEHLLDLKQRQLDSALHRFKELEEEFCGQSKTKMNLDIHVNRLMADTSILRNEVTSLSNKNELMNDSIVVLRSRTLELEEIVTSQERSLQLSWCQMNEAAKSELTARSELKIYKERSLELSSNIKKMREEHLSVKSSHDALEAENMKIREQFAVISESFESAKSNVIATTLKLEDAETLNKSLQQSLLNMKANFSHVSSECRTLTAVRSELQKDLITRSERISELEAMLQDETRALLSERERVQGLEVSLTSMKADVLRTESEAEVLKDSLHKEVVSNRERQLEMSGLLAEAEKREKSLQDELNKSREVISYINKLSGQLDASSIKSNVRRMSGLPS